MLNMKPANAIPTSEERLCYYCNEGRCALCTGWDKTVIDGRIIEVPCAHGCRDSAARKPNQSVGGEDSRQRQRA